MTRPVVLVVIDGWGCNDDDYGNAIAAARTPVMDRLAAEGRSTRVAASGEAVGLPAGQQGNSEVGHLTIGAGRVVFQDLPRITRDIATGAFFANAELVAAADRARERGTLHLIGLISPGGVHSHVDHALALLELARRHQVRRVAVHAVLDGRDEPPTSGAAYLRTFLEGMERVGTGRLATLSGRYWTMDRDRRWERTARAAAALLGGDAATVDDPVGAVEAAYARGVTDEFLEPCAVVGLGEERVAIEDGDTVVTFNFRPDRMRQLCQVLTGRAAAEVGMEPPRDLRLVTFTEYLDGLTPHVAFPKAELSETLAEVVSQHGLRQHHVAETEKYAHVTYFLNGGREEPFAGEERTLVPSPKVATYDSAPRMSAEPVTDAVVARVRAGEEALVVVNLANPDMVGHTGVFDPTVEAVECVDACIGRILEAIEASGGALVVTADHGNAEYKIDRRDGSPLTAHTTAPVPVLLAGDGSGPLRDGGGLADVAPTVLGLLDLPVPAVMTGRDLRRP